jgi:uncharacterized heparinase superfamily protein
MNAIAKALRLWHTVRWLKPVQVYGRVWFRVARPKPDLRPAPAARAMRGAWVEPARREPSLVSATQMRFLGEERDLDAHGWDDASLAKLWRYNQHYFDDLCADGAAGRAAWHRELIARWMRECAPGRGTAWEPYPSSLRIVNWIKWLRAGNQPVPGMLDSLAAQARFLSRRLEWHLLGNHLFVNAKALVYAGTFFEGPEADAWRAAGWRILRPEIPEQILADGGQFERSPMYHALAVEDMLDLANLFRAYPAVSVARDAASVGERIEGMRAFLRAVCHPDGEVAFFNDSAQGVAPTLSELEAYARRLGGPPAPPTADGLRVLDPSGYIRVDRGDCAAILDVGPVGPDYLPGHAHADTLSFELSIGGRRVLVNSGTSQYGLGPERLRQRGTAAHNSVTVDGSDSSEVWGGFRVARRARAFVRRVVEPGGHGAVVEAEHDGFTRLPGGGAHRRTWTFGSGPSNLVVEDEVTARGTIESHWHFAPAFALSVVPGSSVLRASDGEITLELNAEGAAWQVTRSTYSPRFGISIPNWKAVARQAGVKSRVRIEWQPCTFSSSPTTSRPR